MLSLSSGRQQAYLAVDQSLLLPCVLHLPVGLGHSNLVNLAGTVCVNILNVLVKYMKVVIMKLNLVDYYYKYRSCSG